MMFNFLVILSLTSALCVTINNYIFPLYQPDLVILVAYQEKGFSENRSCHFSIWLRVVTNKLWGKSMYRKGYPLMPRVHVNTLYDKSGYKTLYGRLDNQNMKEYNSRHERFSLRMELT